MSMISAKGQEHVKIEAKIPEDIDIAFKQFNEFRKVFHYCPFNEFALAPPHAEQFEVKLLLEVFIYVCTYPALDQGCLWTKSCCCSEQGDILPERQDTDTRFYRPERKRNKPL